jgi:hypothetical protein
MGEDPLLFRLLKALIHRFLMAVVAAPTPEVTEAVTEEDSLEGFEDLRSDR